MAAKDTLGRRGEQLAASYLEGCGYTIADRNWRCPQGEIDIVAWHGHELVFVEVKTRSSVAFGHPLEAITAVKLARLRRLAAAWCEAHPGPHDVVRIDGIAVIAPRGDPLNDVVRTEQGYIYTITTGTLLAPVQKVTIRDRTRPATVSQTFAMTEIHGSPDFIRNITNIISSVKVDGVNSTQTVKDDSLKPFVESASTSGSTLFTSGSDLIAWGQDRLIRGKNVALRIASFTIDPRSLPSNRRADIQGLVPGDRIQITGLPSAQLGFSTLDAWVIGGAENHGPSTSKFTFYISPTLPRTAVFDTEDDRYMADGVLYLSANVNASATSLSIATYDPITRFTTSGADFPIDVIVGAEQMRATGCSAATPQVMTVVRGVNGTTAATHTAGDLLDLAEESLIAF